MRNSVFIAGALLSGVAAMAQESAPTPMVETGLNYSFARVNPGGALSGFSQNGGSAYVEYNVSRVVGLVADFGAYHNGTIQSLPVNDTTFSYLFGPRFNWRRSHFTPYIQTLVGGARLNTALDPAGNAAPAAVTQNVFAAALGGGLDIPLKNHFVVKPIQIEYLMLHPPAGAPGLNYAQNDLRYSAGVAFRFGSK
jgi:hypothetical protein